MKKVLKYKICLGGVQGLELPYDYTPLSVGIQGDEVVMWVLCDPTAMKVSRKFTICCTGEPIDFEIIGFIGTVSKSGFVFHIFECK